MSLSAKADRARVTGADTVAYAQPLRSPLYRLHVLGFLALLGWTLLAFASQSTARPLPVFLGVMAWEWLIFLAAWRVAAKDISGKTLRPIIGWACAFMIWALFSQPMMEDDYFRFLWDGRVFATTGNPYGVAPASYFQETNLSEQFQHILDNINYPHVPTIYGPVCELAFLLTYWVAPAQLWPWKILLTLSEFAFLWLVVARAHYVKQAPESTGHSLAGAKVRGALVVGWCPLVIFETGFNLHPDMLAVALLSAALLFRVRGREALCGVFCGLACASKIFALLLAPFLLLRSGKAWLGFLGAFLLGYSPFWLQGSAADFAGLLTFSTQWEFNSSVFGLVRWACGAASARIICGLAFAAVWCWLFQRWLRQSHNGADCAPPGLQLYGAFLLLSATVNPWYLLWLAPFVALRPSMTAVTAMAMASLSYITSLNLGLSGPDNFAHPTWLRPLEYAPICLAAALEWPRWKESCFPPINLGAKH